MESVLTGCLNFSSLKQLDLTKCSKTDLHKYFLNTYSLNESIFTALKDENVFYCYPDRLRLPLIFYFGHTAAVYINKLLLAGLIKERINLGFETLFETGVDEMSWDDTACSRMGGSFKWPPVKDVVDYRRQVKNAILDVIEKTPLELPITMDSPWWSLLMGMEHERIHLETSSVLIRQLPISMVVKRNGWNYAPIKSDSAVTENPFLVVKSKEVTLGKPRDFPSYGWDNEYGQETMRVPKFEATKYLVTNREFLEFVLDNGYKRQELWSAEGWKWKAFFEAKHPTFWVCDYYCKNGCGEDLANISHCQPIENSKVNGKNCTFTSQYRYRLMFDVIDLPLDFPVEVNYHEAKAFCSWRGPNVRLPTEAEMALIKGKKISPAEGVECDMIHHDDPPANINLKFGSPTPVDYFPPSSTGFYDSNGNVWQWTEDHFNGLDEFYTHWLYDDFSSPCFGGKHNVILGGSWISTGNEASYYGRFAFRRHFFQHAGFRLARSLGVSSYIPVKIVGTHVHDQHQEYTSLRNFSVTDSSNSQFMFDEKLNISRIIELEFGISESVEAASAQMAVEFLQEGAFCTKKALVLGSGAGRTAFELSKSFLKVLTINYSTRLIKIAEEMQSHGHLTITDSDDVTRKYSIDEDCRPENVVFKQLTWLPNEIDRYDLVMVMFIERVQNPHAWLARLWETVSKKGLVVIVSKDGVWSHAKLELILKPRLMHVFDKPCDYQCTGGAESANLSIWSIDSQ